MCSTQDGPDDPTFCVEQYIKQEVKLEDEGDFIKPEIKSEPGVSQINSADDFTPCYDNTHSFDTVKAELVFKEEASLGEGTGVQISADDIATAEINNSVFDKDGEIHSNRNTCSDESGVRKEQERSHKCSTCSYSTDRMGDLVRHVRTHTGDKPFKCDVCSFAASHKHHLIEHTRIHTGEKLYKCNVCSYAAGQRHHLVQHTRIHTGEKPYKCTVCLFSTAQKGNLIEHIRIHTGEKPYKCTMCPFSTAQKGNLIRHIRIHTGEKPYKCKMCSYAAGQRHHLVQHIRIHTGEKPFKCDVCSYAAARKRNLDKHTTREHTGDHIILLVEK